MSRHYLYILLFSLFLFLFVLLFAFLVLIPKGKEYRQERLALKKSSIELQKYQDFHDEVYEKLKDLQSKNRHIITAFDEQFNPQRFVKENKSYFASLKLSKLATMPDEEGFSVYEVNTSSHISSPANFYSFLDGINKSDWIIGVNFPIVFKREGEMIASSFRMKVYCNKSDTNTSKSGSEAK
jgi:hypothetical protein